MTEKREFSRMFIANLKKTAAIVASDVRKKEKLQKEIKEREEELAKVEQNIEEYQGPIRRHTGGYTTEDLVVKVVKEGKPDKDGNPTKVYSFQLKYPETVVPPVDEEGDKEVSPIDDLPFMTEDVLNPDNTL